jgi:deferrochelatase/peroxidase EfeB
MRDELATGAVDDGGNRGLSRRRLLEIAGVAGGAMVLGVGARDVVGAAAGTKSRRGTGTAAVPFFGEHQAGITTPSQHALWFGSFDSTAETAAELSDLLRTWTNAAAELTAGRPVSRRSKPPRHDSGEAVGLGPARLTLTIGVGPTLFERAGVDWYGIRKRSPAALVELPSFRGGALQPERSGGDLCVQACADDPQVAFHAFRMLTELGRGAVELRWSQQGFNSVRGAGSTPRNLLGFKDGTNNLHGSDLRMMASNVWVGREGPEWMRGGTYMVVRRVRLRLEHWDGETVGEQEHTFGRRKASGAPLGERAEHDPVDPAKLPPHCHIILANPRVAGSEQERILRRGYSFADGIDSAGGELDAGLFFVGFQRDPRRQFIRIQSRLAADDLLNEYTVHTGSAIFAIPAGTRHGRYIGQSLLSP